MKSKLLVRQIFEIIPVWDTTATTTTKTKTMWRSSNKILVLKNMSTTTLSLNIWVKFRIILCFQSILKKLENSFYNFSIGNWKSFSPPNLFEIKISFERVLGYSPFFQLYLLCIWGIKQVLKLDYLKFQSVESRGIFCYKSVV